MDDADDPLAALARRLEGTDLEGTDLEGTDLDVHDELFRSFYAPLVRYARSITKADASARDAVQDVFLKLWERRDTLHVRSSLKAMLYTMVRNRALNINRWRQRHPTGATVPEARRGQGAHAPPPDLEVEAEQLRVRLHRWVGELPPRRAEAFTLSRYHALSHEEIAETMDISKRTVDTHVYHALRDLRARLDALDDEPRLPEN